MSSELTILVKFLGKVLRVLDGTVNWEEWWRFELQSESLSSFLPIHCIIHNPLRLSKSLSLIAPLYDISALNIDGKDVQKDAHPIILYKLALFSSRTNTSRLSYEFMITMNKQKSISVKEKWHRDIGCTFEGTLKDIRISTGNPYLQSLPYRWKNNI